MSQLYEDVLGEFNSGDPVALLLAALMGSEEHAQNRDVLHLITAINGPITKMLYWCAAEALGKLADPRAATPLMRLLREGDTSVQARAAVALAGMHERRAVDLLIERLDSPDASMRTIAAESLGNMGDEPAIGPLISALADSDHNVRIRAADGLHKLGEPAFQALVGALESPDSRIRQGAANALGRQEEQRAVDDLFAMLRSDEDIDVRETAAYNLAELGDVGLQRLIAVLGDADWHVRGFAAAALLEVAAMESPLAEQAIEPLHALLSDENVDVRRAAASTLRMFGDWTATHPIPGPAAYVGTVYADHHQFCLCDSAFTDVPERDDDERYKRRLSVGPPTCIDLFVKTYGIVPVAVEVTAEPPDNDFTGWDHVVEASLDVPSGAIAFRDLFEDDPSEPVVWVRPGMYRVRVYYGNLGRSAWGGDDDYYRFVMWPAELYEAPVVLHINHLAMSRY